MNSAFLEMRRIENWRRRWLVRWYLILCGLHMKGDIHFEGFLWNGQVIRAVKERSSPTDIITTKGSSVWLHWNYTYVGDGIHTGVFFPYTVIYQRQEIGFKSNFQPSMQALARRFGQHGSLTLEPSIPSPFTGRVGVISSNSTLVIHGLQYNDSTCQFISNISTNLDIGTGFQLKVFDLKPTATITVHGIPEFITNPPIALDVNENSTLVLPIIMDGNPKPTATFRWTLLRHQSQTSVPTVQIYPFVYSSRYELNNIDGRYCGRILQTALTNSIGLSLFRNTKVTVFLNLDKPFHLRAEKTNNPKCVQVEWTKVESGACFVRYELKLKSDTGDELYNETEYNIGESKICNLTMHSDVTNAQLKIGFKNVSKVVNVTVSEAPTTPQTLNTTEQSTTSNRATERSKNPPSISSRSGSPCTVSGTLTTKSDTSRQTAYYTSTKLTIRSVSPSTESGSLSARPGSSSIRSSLPTTRSAPSTTRLDSSSKALDSSSTWSDLQRRRPGLSSTKSGSTCTSQSSSTASIIPKSGSPSINLDSPSTTSSSQNTRSGSPSRISGTGTTTTGSSSTQTSTRSAVTITSTRPVQITSFSPRTRPRTRPDSSSARSGSPTTWKGTTSGSADPIRTQCSPAKRSGSLTTTSGLPITKLASSIIWTGTATARSGSRTVKADSPSAKSTSPTKRSSTQSTRSSTGSNMPSRESDRQRIRSSLLGLQSNLSLIFGALVTAMTLTSSHLLSF